MSGLVVILLENNCVFLTIKTNHTFCSQLVNKETHPHLRPAPLFVVVSLSLHTSVNITKILGVSFVVFFVRSLPLVYCLLRAITSDHTIFIHFRRASPSVAKLACTEIIIAANKKWISNQRILSFITTTSEHNK